MTDTVIVKKENHICFIKMNQPEKRNALSSELISGLKAALEDAEQDADIRAIILSGEGNRAFLSIKVAAYFLELIDRSLLSINIPTKSQESIDRALITIKVPRKL